VKPVFDLVFCLMLTGVIVIILFLFPAFPADFKDCSRYALVVATTVKALTNDDDVAMAAQSRAEAYCIVLDEPPIVRLSDPAPKKTAALAPPPSAHVTACRKYYRSYDEATDTVIRRGQKGRSKCPL
jgi:hypothetical protein